MWPWLTLLGLGAFHGLNPAMGWLFAVGLGLQAGDRRAVLRSLPPIALGHAVAIAIVAIPIGAARLAFAPAVLQAAAALALIGFGLFRLARGYRHRFRVGMVAGFRDLALWSFLMATAHGAGLMVAPLLIDLPQSGHAVLHGAMPAGFDDALTLGLAAAAVHTAAMLATAGIVAIVVFDRVGLAILRRGWINIDLLWSAMLVLAGLALLAVALSAIASPGSAPAHH